MNLGMTPVVPLSTPTMDTSMAFRQDLMAMDINLLSYLNDNISFNQPQSQIFGLLDQARGLDLSNYQEQGIIVPMADVNFNSDDPADWPKTKWQRQIDAAVNSLKRLWGYEGE